MVQKFKGLRRRTTIVIVIICVTVVFVCASARILVLMNLAANRATNGYMRDLEVDSEKTREYFEMLRSLGIKFD